MNKKSVILKAEYGSEKKPLGIFLGNLIGKSPDDIEDYLKECDRSYTLHTIMNGGKTKSCGKKLKSTSR